MSLPGITVVTPCLDAAGTIEQTIASVAAQDYPPELLEHIVVDGGSTDGTLEIVRRSGLVHVSEPDRGLSHALNKGLAMAHHQIFAELNADDLYLPGALRRVGEAFSTHPDAEWVTGPCLIVDERGAVTRRTITAYKRLLLRRWTFARHLTHNFVSAPATFARTAVLRELDGFDERFRYSMDYDLWLRLGRRGAPVILDVPLAAFRMAGASLSLTGFERQFEEHAVNAAEHGEGHRCAVLVNRLASRGIVAAYRIRRRAARR
jgi:glycosyltransferase involved in cell wall biosynthesis